MPSRRRFLSLAGLFAARAAAQSVIGTLNDRDVDESSGVVASRLNPGVFWTHNDSGGRPMVFAFDLTGRVRGRWRLRKARNVDWEDIAIAPGANGQWNLYIGDIGDNPRRREEIVVYCVPEPRLGAAVCGEDCAAAPSAILRLRYPDGPHNAETLLVHPVTKDLYILTKSNSSDPETIVFAARAANLGARPALLETVARLDLTDPLLRAIAGGLTGGDISPDGRKVVLCDYLNVHEAAQPEGAFDRIWKGPFVTRPIGIMAQVEGVCFRPGGGLLLTGEGSPCPLIGLPEPLATGVSPAKGRKQTR